MALSLIVGKPGSGKSYYAVLKIAEYLTEWARYEIREGAPFQRALYTNLHLNIDEINRYVKLQIGQDFDVTPYIFMLEDSFFYEETDGRRQPIAWWDNVPNGALLVFDEVHTYIPAQGVGGRDFMQLFIEYCSTHRHRQQDLIFITQHTDNIHKSVLCLAGDAYHVCNVKSRVIPFLRIPFSDIDVVKEAWGCFRQVANIIYGNYLGRSFKKESTTTIVLKPEIFALYQSHTLSGAGDSVDRPSLNLGRIGSIFWFIRRHWWHLAIKAALVYGAVWAIYFVLTDAPQRLSKSISKDIESKKPAASKKTITPLRDTGGYSPSSYSFSRSTAEDEEEEKQLIVFVYGKDYLLTNQGRKKIGDEYEEKGETFRIVSIDYVYQDFFSDSIPRVCPALPPSVVEAEPGQPELQADERDCENF